MPFDYNMSEDEKASTPASSRTNRLFWASAKLMPFGVACALAVPSSPGLTAKN